VKLGQAAATGAALTVLGLLQAAWLISGAPLSLKAGVVGLVALSCYRPSWGLLILAGLAALPSAIATLAGAPNAGAQLLEMMAIAVVTGAVVKRSSADAPTRLALPALVMGVVVLASGLAELPARLMTSTLEHVGAPTIARMLFDHAIDRIPPLDPWYFTVLVLEGAALAWAAESIVRREPDTAARAVWCALLGHAGVALLNITRVIGAALRSQDYPASLVTAFVAVREHTQYDVNAGASIFVMVALAGLGLWSRRSRLPLAVSIGAVTAGLWVAGSRVAMAALLITVTAVLALRVRRSRRALWITAAAVVATVGVVGWLAVGYPAGRNLSLSKTVASRLILFKAAGRMAAESPITGVGAGTFLEASSHYGTEALAPLVYDGRTRDNAHNYFLQTLAEQGLLGLGALLVMLAAALWPTVRASARRDVMTTWLAAGVVGSALTWVSGHPLLVTEAALMFWLFVGVLAGASEAPIPSPTRRRIALVAVVAILASLPFRANTGERAADLEHMATGVSVWQPAVDGVRYREGATEFSLFLPGGGLVVLPMRSASAQDVRVELSVESRVIDAVVAPAGTWREVRLQVPERASRYVKIDFRVVEPVPCQACVWVGKDAPVSRQ